MPGRIGLVKILGGIVIATGLAVVVGWVFDIGALKSILPAWVTMKFSTAICFIASGLILYFGAQAQRGNKEIAQLVLPISSLVIFLFMASLLASVFLGIRTGIEDLFVQETVGAVKTTTPGRPSVGTMVDFILIGVTGILVAFRISGLRQWLLRLGVIVGTIGAVGVTGYILDQPLLYYTIPGFSTAMACHTAILFTLVGIGLFLVGSVLGSETGSLKAKG